MTKQMDQENFMQEEENQKNENNLNNTLEKLDALKVHSKETIKADNLAIDGNELSKKVGSLKWGVKEKSKQYHEVYTRNRSMAEAAEEKKEKYKGLTEHERACHYWETQLHNEVRIEKPQNSNCEFAIIIPVYNEQIERILKQIESLKNQQDIDPSQFEIIYVVNNDISKENKKSKEVINANQAVIAELQNISGLNIFVIDKSSPGNEIEHCNVGKARNRGVAEASLRFYENGKNGTLIQTDADTYFEDQNYLVKLKTILNDNPDAIGLAGGLIFEFSPDINNREKMADLQKKIKTLFLVKKWELFVQFLRDPESLFFTDKAFCGANMISKSYESAVVGGLIDANAGEDPQFGFDLEAYASGRGQKVIGVKSDLFVVTALRDSDRTAASFKKYFDKINIDRPMMVSDPFGTETLPQFRKKITTILEKPISDSTELKTLLTNKHGDLIVSTNSFNELVEHARQQGFQENNIFYKQWLSKNFGEDYDLAHQLYDALYPQIPLTEKNYQCLVNKVKKEKNGAQLVEYLDAVIENLRIH